MTYLLDVIYRDPDTLLDDTRTIRVTVEADDPADARAAALDVITGRGLTPISVVGA